MEEKVYLSLCEELKKEYESIGSLVNPLVLIQIPNEITQEEKELYKKLEEINLKKNAKPI